MSAIRLLVKRPRYIFRSAFCRFTLKMIHGVHVGKSFYCEDFPRLQIRGSASNIRIGDNVKFLGQVDIRNRENGRVEIGNNVTIEGGCRFVSARDGRITIGEGTAVGADAVWNGGGDIVVGNKCLFGVRSSINANEHLMKRHRFIRDQGFVHAPVVIENDCWFGVNVAINKGCVIREGSVIGANAVVVRDTERYSVSVGVPAKQIAERE